MPNKELSFIEQQIKEGVKRSEIKAHMRARGYFDEKEVEDAVDVVCDKLTASGEVIPRHFYLRRNISHHRRSDTAETILVYGSMLFVLLVILCLSVYMYWI